MIPLLKIPTQEHELEIYITTFAGTRTVAKMDLYSLGNRSLTIRRNSDFQKMMVDTGRTPSNMVIGRAEFMRCVLTHQVQESLLLLERYDPYVVLNKKQFILSMIHYPKNTAEFDAFTEVAVTIANQI